VEDHEIAVYGTLRRWAEILGLSEDATVLESIEAEEENADAVLSEIAERVNFNSGGSFPQEERVETGAPVSYQRL
jgi:ferritin-like metal-binding protein YciE